MEGAVGRLSVAHLNPTRPLLSRYRTPLSYQPYRDASARDKEVYKNAFEGYKARVSSDDFFGLSALRP
jgi:hypothetical protein